MKRHVKVRLLGDLRPPRVHDDELGAGPARPVDHGHEVEVRPRHVAAPGDDQLRVLGLLGANARHRTERPDPRLRPDAAAQGAAVQQAGAEPVEEAEIHRAAGEQAVRPGVVERQDRLRPVSGDHGRKSVMDDVERLGPRDPLEAPFALGADASERRLEAALAVDEAWVRLRNLGAEDAGRVGVRTRAADRDDALVLDRDGQAAGVGAIERTHAGTLGFHSVSPVGALLIAARTISLYTLPATGERAITSRTIEPIVRQSVREIEGRPGGARASPSAGGAWEARRGPPCN